MSRASILARGQRRTNEVLLSDGVVWVHRDDPDATSAVFDEETMQYSDVEQVTVYRGPGRWQIRADINAGLIESTAGEHESAYATSQLQTPVYAPLGSEGDPGEIRADDVAEVVACPTNPSMLGRAMNIHGPYHKSDPTYLRFRIKEVVA